MATALEAAQRLNLLGDYITALNSIGHHAEDEKVVYIKGLKEELEREEDIIMDRLKEIEIDL